MAECKLCAAHPPGPPGSHRSYYNSSPGPRGHFVWRGCHFAVTAPPPHTHTLPLDSKAPCLLFHSPLYLPEELPHFNINRMLHHAVAQALHCSAGISGGRSRYMPRTMEHRRHAGKKQTCFVYSFKRAELVCFVWEVKCGNVATESRREEAAVCRAKMGFYFGLIHGTARASLTHKMCSHLSACQRAGTDTGDLIPHS